MRYTDSLLADGEVIVRRARQHWLAVAVDGRRGWVLLVIGVLALVVGLFLRDGTDPGQTIGSVLSVVALLALLAGLALVVYQVLAWRAQDYVVTNRRVVQVEGIFNKRAADSSLEKINDAVLVQNVLGRILRYGDLEVLTASESAIDRFHMLARAADFKREMLNQKHALEMEVARSQRFGNLLSVVMIDIDHFKLLNDRCGHPVGDKALRKVGELLRSAVRKVDTVARYGGEEFFILLPRSDKAEGLEVAEKLRELIEQTAFEGGDGQPGGRVTISLGVSTFPTDAETMERLVDGVDSALYASKRGGRNKVTAYAAGMELADGRERGPLADLTEAKAKAS